MLVYTETTFNLAKLYREVYFRFASEFQYVILSERDWLGGRAKPLPCLHVGQRGENTCRLSAFVVVPVCGREGGKDVSFIYFYDSACCYYCRAGVRLSSLFSALSRKTFVCLTFDVWLGTQ